TRFRGLARLRHAQSRRDARAAGVEARSVAGTVAPARSAARAVLMTAASSVAYTVRQLEARDLPVLQQSQLADWTPANALSATRESRVLVLQREQDEEVAGIAEYQRILDEGSLLGIAIVPALQRRGLGLCLLLGVLD